MQHRWRLHDLYRRWATQTIAKLVNIPSGKHSQFAIEHGPVEIVDLPIENGDFPSLCKRLPEGKL